MQMVLIFQRNCSQSLKELDFSFVRPRFPCGKLICVKLEDGSVSAEVAAGGAKANFQASSKIAFVAHLAAITYVETQRIMP